MLSDVINKVNFTPRQKKPPYQKMFPSLPRSPAVHPDDARWSSIQKDLDHIEEKPLPPTPGEKSSFRAVDTATLIDLHETRIHDSMPHYPEVVSMNWLDHNRGKSFVAPPPGYEPATTSRMSPTPLGFEGVFPPSQRSDQMPIVSRCLGHRPPPGYDLDYSGDLAPLASSSRKGSPHSGSPAGTSPPPGFEGTPSSYSLIDIREEPTNSQLKQDAPRATANNSTLILQSNTTGYIFGKPNIGDVSKITMERGTLVRPLNELLDEEVASRLRPFSHSTTDVFVKDILHSDMLAIVRASDTMRISDTQAMLLLSSSASERFLLHRDLERFHFVESLKEGDAVTVEMQESADNLVMYPGRVVWIGDRPRRCGIWYKVEMTPPYGMKGGEWSAAPRNVYASAAHLHKPMTASVSNTYDYRPSPRVTEERIIPIRRVETTFDAADNSTLTRTVNRNIGPPIEGLPAHNSQFSSDQYSFGGDPIQEWRDVPQRREPREDERNGITRGRRNHMPPAQHHPVQCSTQPSRSQSAHVVCAHDRTFSVDDPMRTKGARVGDRCVWRDGPRQNKGTIRFIGHLKGHTNLYAGVEFDDAVGKGTGVFQGETIFKTSENRAGFVVFDTLEVLPRRPETAVTPPDTTRTPHFSIRHKQASAESLSDPPPPVPKRPVMQPEDYMIDSFSVGSCVEVCHVGACRSGVVRWIGDAMSEDGDHLERSAVVELDDDVPAFWRPAPCTSADAAVVPRSVLVPTSSLRRDRRIHGSDSDSSPTHSRFNGKPDFGSIDSGIETTKCEPWRVTEDLVGRMKGIQGHRNSCYLDATLYAMFVQSTMFDHLLERPRNHHDIPQYGDLVRLLATEIVYPLRKFHYVRADHVMRMREMLAEILPSVKGLTSEEKDPEEILGELFGTILKADPFLELINLKDNTVDRMYLCPLIIDDWQTGVATTQHLLERSMRAAGVKFAQPPRTLIVQLPRYGQQKVFEKILPLERIDITGLVHNAVQACHACGKPADGMCPECFLCKRVFLTEVSFCASCFKRTHVSGGEPDHVMRPFYPPGKPGKKAASHKMSLSAVLCIETSHYVAYVKSTTGKWLFFDSMADREGLSDGFNVPQVKESERISWWLSPAGWDRLRNADEVGRTQTVLGKGSDVDPLVNRLLSDSYICFYQQEDRLPSSSSNNLINNVLQKMKL